jgi:hypothetical protein
MHARDARNLFHSRMDTLFCEIIDTTHTVMMENWRIRIFINSKKCMIALTKINTTIIIYYET